MTGLSAEVIAGLVAEVGPVRQARQDARLAGRPRRRAVGAGAKYKLVFVDRLLTTLVHLRHAATHDVLAAWFGVLMDKSRQHAVKALIISDARGRVLFGGASCPGSTADITQARQAGVVDWLHHTTGVEILTDAGYQGLGHRTFGQILTPTPKHHKKRLENMPGIAALTPTT